MIIDGRRIADDIVVGLGASLRGRRLGVLMTEGDKVTDSFVRIKERVAERLGVAIVRARLPQGATTLEALEALKDLCLHADGVIVQLPLPAGIDLDLLLEALPAEKDIDAFSPMPRARAPVAEALGEVLVRAGVDARGKRAVVVGEGRLVGKPCAELLRERGAATTVITLERGSLDELKDAHIVVLGAGSPGLVKPAMLMEGVVLVDAGTSESNGKVAGDADPACAEVASVFTPVPGGMGPIAVAMIFKNLFALAQK